MVIKFQTIQKSTNLYENNLDIKNCELLNFNSGARAAFEDIAVRNDALLPWIRYSYAVSTTK